MSFTLSQLFQYFEDLATSHQAIRHSSQRRRFWKLTIDDILGNGLQGLPKAEPILIMEDLEFNAAGQDPDAQGRIRRMAFIIAKNVDGVMNSKGMFEAYQLAETIGDQFMRKIYQDSMDQEGDLFANGLLDFDQSSIEAMTVGPILTNCYGMRYSFNLVDEYNLLQEDDVWQ
jgi:hypothetical protein